VRVCGVYDIIGEMHRKNSVFEWFSYVDYGERELILEIHRKKTISKRV
jgi:hypothetical protein